MRTCSRSWPTVAAALGPLAKPCPAVENDGTTVPDRRTVGQRQADALVELTRRALAAGDLVPTGHGFPAHVAITIDYDALHAGVGVAMLDTGAPISASAVRRICCDTHLLPIQLGSDGVPLDVGRLQRIFAKELRRAIVIRDIGCAKE